MVRRLKFSSILPSSIVKRSSKKETRNAANNAAASTSPPSSTNNESTRPAPGIRANDDIGASAASPQLDHDPATSMSPPSSTKNESTLVSPGSEHSMIKRSSFTLKSIDGSTSSCSSNRNVSYSGDSMMGSDNRLCDSEPASRRAASRRSKSMSAGMMTGGSDGSHELEYDSLPEHRSYSAPTQELCFKPCTRGAPPPLHGQLSFREIPEGRKVEKFAPLRTCNSEDGANSGFIPQW